MSDLLSLSLTEARDALKAKKTSSTELTEAYIGAMEAGKSLNAFITETPDKARAMAKASDEKLARGEGGAMEGLPIGIKDLFCTQGVLTTAASHILDGFKP
ncbi:amidase family protein, partial [Roseovarius sp.]|uniref:amidase family protein n=1 Tax=Roseovarius sp. TaxID=1486281 RepID=UPI003A96A0F9